MCVSAYSGRRFVRSEFFCLPTIIANLTMPGWCIVNGKVESGSDSLLYYCQRKGQPTMKQETLNRNRRFVLGVMKLLCNFYIQLPLCQISPLNDGHAVGRWRTKALTARGQLIVLSGICDRICTKTIARRKYYVIFADFSVRFRTFVAYLWQLFLQKQ